MWQCHSNPEGQLNVQKCLCSCSHKQEKFLFPSACGPVVLAGGAGLLEWGVCCSQGVPDAAPGRVQSPPRGWRPAGTLRAGSPRPASPSAPRKARLDLGHSFTLPCATPAPGAPGRGSWALQAPEGDVRAAGGISPPRCADAAPREPGTAAARHSLPGQRHALSRSHGNNVRGAGGGQSRPRKPKAPLTPSGRGDEAQHQPRLVFSLRGSEPTWEELPSGAGSCDPACS